MKTVKLNKVERADFEREIYEIKELIANLGTGKPVEIRAPSPQGPKVTQADIDKWNAAAEKTVTLQNLVEKLVKETKDLEKLRTMVGEI